MKKLIIFVLLCALFSSCATIFTGSYQQIVFAAPAGTQLFLDGMFVAEIPQGYDAVSVEVKRSLAGMDMVARKSGYGDTRFFVRAQVNGVVFVNILLGPSVILGAGIDLLTGAAAQYPNYVQISLPPLRTYDAGSTPADGDSAPAVVDDILKL